MTTKVFLTDEIINQQYHHWAHEKLAEKMVTLMEGIRALNIRTNHEGQFTDWLLLGTGIDPAYTGSSDRLSCLKELSPIAVHDAVDIMEENAKAYIERHPPLPGYDG